MKDWLFEITETKDKLTTTNMLKDRICENCCFRSVNSNCDTDEWHYSMWCRKNNEKPINNSCEYWSKYKGDDWPF